jgi:hypothetical protein
VRLRRTSATSDRENFIWQLAFPDVIRQRERHSAAAALGNALLTLIGIYRYRARGRYPDWVQVSLSRQQIRDLTTTDQKTVVGEFTTACSTPGGRT